MKEIKQITGQMRQENKIKITKALNNETIEDEKPKKAKSKVLKTKKLKVTKEKEVIC